jgi:hypothetical protein
MDLMGADPGPMDPMGPLVPIDPVDPMDLMAAADPPAAGDMAAVDVAAVNIRDRDAPGSVLSPTGAFGENERRMSS